MPPDLFARKNWLSVLAKAPAARLEVLLPELPEHRFLRSPEIGTVMVQGRTGSTGAPFSLGEITVTRASVQLSCGTEGHAMVQGRDRGHATRAALIDALMQTPQVAAIEAQILTPLRQEAESRRHARAARAAATRVEFFTLVRGENA